MGMWHGRLLLEVVGGEEDGNGENLGKDDIVILGRVAVGLWRRLLEGFLHFSLPLDQNKRK